MNYMRKSRISKKELQCPQCSCDIRQNYCTSNHYQEIYWRYRTIENNKIKESWHTDNEAMPTVIAFPVHCCECGYDFELQAHITGIEIFDMDGEE